MRQWNETGDDLRKEREVAEHLGREWGFTVSKLPPTSYPADFGLYSPPARKIVGIKQLLVGLLEVKCRDTLMWPAMLSLQKAERLMSYRQNAGKPVVVAFQHQDKIWCHKVQPGIYQIGEGGRTDRGQTGDMEPVILIEKGQCHAVEFVSGSAQRHPVVQNGGVDVRW